MRSAHAVLPFDPCSIADKEKFYQYGTTFLLLCIIQGWLSSVSEIVSSMSSVFKLVIQYQSKMQVSALHLLHFHYIFSTFEVVVNNLSKFMLLSTLLQGRCSVVKVQALVQCKCKCIVYY
jgi:hypothetical protein